MLIVRSSQHSQIPPSVRPSPDPRPAAPLAHLTFASLRAAPRRTVVHPLVLLSVADHHARAVSRGSTKRVVGILLGQDNGTTVNVANSFGIPFEEDDKDSKTWFLDHNYIEGMWEMCKKVNGP